LHKPSKNAKQALTGPLKNCILSELNAWELTVMPNEEVNEWVKMSLAPEFKILGKKFGMKVTKAIITNMSYADALAVIEKGTLKVGVTINTKTKFNSKLSFTRECANWESASSPNGGCVVAVDCTHDEVILLSRMAWELITYIQKLRKSTNLEMQDVIEAFFLTSMVQLMSWRMPWQRTRICSGLNLRVRFHHQRVLRQSGVLFLGKMR